MSLLARLAPHLPYVRRYARALTGSQDTGDRYAAATLEAILEDDSILSGPLPARIALFRAFHLVWGSAGAPLGTPDSEMSRRAQDHMAALTPNTREALLLHAIEGFSTVDIGKIMGLTAAQAETLIQIAKQEMAESVAGSVLIIEDEAIIAMDIQMIVSEIGHRVTGIAFMDLPFQRQHAHTVLAAHPCDGGGGGAVNLRVDRPQRTRPARERLAQRGRAEHRAAEELEAARAHRPPMQVAQALVVQAVLDSDK